MEILILTAGSILTITALVWIVNKILSWHICPICAGVSGTWLWMLAGVLSGFLPLIFSLPVSIMMGGSITGIAYQIEKRLPPKRSALLWKTLFIPIGFMLVESVFLKMWFLTAAFSILEILLALGFLFWKKHAKSEKRVEKLEEKMKNCC